MQLLCIRVRTHQFVDFDHPLVGWQLRVQMLAVALGQIHEFVVPRMPQNGLCDEDDLIETQRAAVQWQCLQMLRNRFERIRAGLMLPQGFFAHRCFTERCENSVRMPGNAHPPEGVGGEGGILTAMAYVADSVADSWSLSACYCPRGTTLCQVCRDCLPAA